MSRNTSPSPSPSTAWSVFVKKFHLFIEKRSHSLSRMSGGRWTVDDARQELHQVIWEACLSPQFRTSREDWKKWLYNRVVWKTYKMIDEMKTRRHRNEVLMSTQIGENEDDGYVSAYLEPSTGDSVERQTEARDWIRKACDRIREDDIPIDYKFVVTAYLEPDESGLAEFAHNRRSNNKRFSNAAKYEFANQRDLVDFTGDVAAAKKLSVAAEFLKRKIGNPLD